MFHYNHNKNKIIKIEMIKIGQITRNRGINLSDGIKF